MDDIKNGDKDIEQIISYAVETLENWKAEDVNGEYDTLVVELYKIDKRYSVDG